MKSNNNHYIKLLIIAIFFSLIGTTDNTFAQNTKPACPIVRVSGIDEVASGEAIVFTANVSGGDPMVTPTFNWTVSAGTISSGQGTSSITVETSNMGGQTITATVDIGGYSRQCPSSNSFTTSVMKQAVAFKVDEYGAIKYDDEKARLDNFAIELQNDPMATAYIITYGGRKSVPKAAQAAADRAKKYLVSVRGVSAGRIIIIDGGYREELTTEFYLVPNGAHLPTASPTVDRSEVKPVKINTPVKKAIPVKKVTTKTVTKEKIN